MACNVAPVDGQVLLEKAASVFSVVPSQIDAAASDAQFAERYVLARDPAFVPTVPRSEQVAMCKKCLTQKLIGAVVIVAVGYTLINVARSIFRKGGK